MNVRCGFNLKYTKMNTKKFSRKNNVTSKLIARAEANETITAARKYYIPLAQPAEPEFAPSLRTAPEPKTIKQKKCNQ